MAGVNRVELLGRLGLEPQLEHLGEKKTPHSRLRLAVERWQGESEVTDWFTVHAWQTLAQACAKSLVAGQRVYVEGHLQVASWQNADGQHRTRLDLVADTIIFLDRPAQGPLAVPPEEEQDA